MPTYIIRSGETGPVKIGRSGDVAKRLIDLQICNPETLSVVRIIDTPFDSEPAFHARFAHKSLHGEWFEFDAEMMTFVPAAPVRPGTKDLAAAAGIAARDEAADLLHEAYKAFQVMENRAAFFRRAAKVLGLSKRRVRAFYHWEARRIEVHEIVGLRDFAARLRSESPLGDAVAEDRGVVSRSGE